MASRRLRATALVVLVTAAGCAAGPKPRVLGTQLTTVVTTTTVAPAPLVPAAPTTTSPQTTRVTRRPAAPPSTVAVTAPPTTTTTSAPPPPPPPTTTIAPESLEPGTYEEHTDQANSYYVAPDGSTQTSAIEVVRRDAPERADVTVLYYGSSVEVQLTDLAGRTILLPDGYRAAVECRRDGRPWRTATAETPQVTSVEPGATVSAVVNLPSDGPGTYDCTATTTIVLP